MICELIALACLTVHGDADGHDIELATQPSEGAQQKLFFVNLGGYDPSAFTELHKNVLIVSPDDKGHWQKPHRDRLFEIEKTLDISDLMLSHGYHLILRLASREKSFQFQCDYRLIGKSR
jgi:hypothetical protein